MPTPHLRRAPVRFRKRAFSPRDWLIARFLQRMVRIVIAFCVVATAKSCVRQRRAPDARFRAVSSCEWRRQRRCSDYEMFDGVNEMHFNGARGAHPSLLSGFACSRKLRLRRLHNRQAPCLRRDRPRILRHCHLSRYQRRPDTPSQPLAQHRCGGPATLDGRRDDPAPLRRHGHPRQDHPQDWRQRPPSSGGRARRSNLPPTLRMWPGAKVGHSP
jgi:hypothetical protein